MVDLPTLQAVISELGQPAYRARQAYEGLTRGAAAGFDEITTLPAALRSELSRRLPATALREVTVREAAGAVKTLLVAADGQPVEAVLLMSRSRATVCASTQVGCAVGCPFCASGRRGLTRDLSAEEMVDQVLAFARRLRGSDHRVTNVVFMGMGEPFHAYDETLRACRLLNDPAGFDLGARAISVSTAGVVPGIDRFAGESLQLNLAVSLHAGTDELRDRLVPLNRRWPLDELFAACERYVTRTRRKLLFEYVVLAGVNDGEDQALALAARLRRPLYHLNLIAYNETGGEFRRPSTARLAAFRHRLEHAGVRCTLRRSPGGDIEAACGQLALRAREDAGRT
jgi:23S rRNA (adenine2503-C2)-methyltransferase